MIFVDDSGFRATLPNCSATFKVTGTAVYLLTETIQKHSKPTGCSCTVRAGRDYLDYHFFWQGDMLYYRNSEGYSGHIDDSASPVASNIYYYIRNYLER